MTAAEQLKKWVDGESIHDIEEDQCCPDFSCCTGRVVPKFLREKFYKAYLENDRKTMMLTLMAFPNLFSRLKIVVLQTMLFIYNVIKIKK